MVEKGEKMIWAAILVYCSVGITVGGLLYLCISACIHCSNDPWELKK